MRVRLSIARLSALVLALLILSALSVPVALAALPRQAATGVTVVANGSDRIANLMPGDDVHVATLEVRGQGSLRYALSSKTSGSTSLARLLIVTIRIDDGSVVYQGPLADARVGDGSDGPSGGRVLRDASEILSISGHLSTGAGNEVQGARLSVTWIVQATQLATDGRP